MSKRIFDLFFSGLGIVILSPVLLIIYLLVLTTSKGGGLYLQERIGRHGVPFKIKKFRTMYVGSDRKGLLTVGKRDPRVTPVGYYLRKTKLDELPQLLNVFLGDMSLVGPRPEVAKYVALYSVEDRMVLEVKPGITDYASIEFRDENQLLNEAKDPEQAYIHDIMPRKLALNKQYIERQSLAVDFGIILKTLLKIIR